MKKRPVETLVSFIQCSVHDMNLDLAASTQTTLTKVPVKVLQSSFYIN
jgi:hypothetical protein